MEVATLVVLVRCVALRVASTLCFGGLACFLTRSLHNRLNPMPVFGKSQADQFKKIHDFARAYGSLCWNLSKVRNPFFHAGCALL